MLTAKNKYFSLFFFVGFAVFSAWWMNAMSGANVEVSEGRYMLHADELVTFDGVKRVYREDSFKGKFDKIIGPDQRYGRPVWYSALLSSFIGDSIAGEKGQIIATRLLFAAMTFISVVLLTLAIVKDRIWQIITIITGVTLPYMAYYATMPKPEPLVFLFLAGSLFCLCKRPNNIAFLFFFLGLAFGTKISVLPAIFTLGGLSLLRYSVSYPMMKSMRATLKSFLAFFTGWIIAVPILVFGGKDGINSYLKQTWQNRTHGADADAVGIVDWMGYISNTAFFGEGRLITLLVIGFFSVLSIAPLLLLMSRAPKKTTYEFVKKIIRSEEAIIAVVYLTGCGFLLSIVVSVSRLWGFYLLPGTLFILIAAIAGTESLLYQREIKNIRFKFGVLSVAAVAIAITSFYGIKSSHNNFQLYANRSESDMHKLKLEKFEYMQSFSNAVSEKISRRTENIFNGSLWQPNTTEKARFSPVYGRYKGWKNPLDVIYLLDVDTNPALIMGRTAELDKLVTEAYQLMVQHSDVEGGCVEEPCYVHITPDIPNLQVFVLKNHANLLNIK